MLIYDQQNFDLHLTQLNCAIANWATIIRIICRPTQMLRAFATGPDTSRVSLIEQQNFGCSRYVALRDVLGKIEGTAAFLIIDV
jgi:hypothetical protein